MTATRSRPSPWVLLTAAALLVVAGCGGGGGGESGSAGAGGPAPDRTGGDRAVGPPRLAPPPCRPDAAGCERASGQIAYVERVDPDGDGDAHFVLISEESITGPGLSVIDVEAGLRPDPLPRPGDLLAASGPVHEGSYGQKQIEADALRWRRVPRR